MTIAPASRSTAVHVGPRGLPDMTIGTEAALWAMDYLQQPDGPDAGTPWQFTPEQLRFWLWWYAVDPSGRFTYRYAMLRRMKGWGKDPLGAVFCAVEFVGPCRFGGWAAPGIPKAVTPRTSWVQTAAVALSQTRNTMTLFPSMFSDRAISEFKIDLGKEIIYAHRGRSRIEAVTSSPRALEGGRATFILKNETHHWIKSNDGLDMADTIARNAAKSRDAAARAMAISNAHNPSEDSDARRDWEAWRSIDRHETKATGILYDSLEAPADTVLSDPESLRHGILCARGDSSWLDVDRLIEEIYDPRTKPSDARRYYLNQISAPEDAYLTPAEWGVLALRAQPVAGRAITLGFDGSKSDDWTALIGCDVETGHEFVLGIWDPSEFEGAEIPREAVDAAVFQAFTRWDVVGFYADVHPWESYIDAWSAEFGEQLLARAEGKHPIGWDMRSRLQAGTRMAEAFHDAVIEAGKELASAEDRVALLEGGTLPITHDGDPTFADHVTNARNRPNRYGMSFGKESADSSSKVDALAAGMLARLARQDYIALPDNKKRKRTRAGISIYIPGDR